MALLLALRPCPAAAEQISAARALALSGVVEMLPPGTVAGDPRSTPAPVLTRALAVRVQREGRPQLWTALLVLEPSAKTTAVAGKRIARTSRLIVARQRGASMERVLSRTDPAPDALMLELGPHRPDGGMVVAVQWASGPAPHEGRIECWGLEGREPVRALDTVGDGFLFQDADGQGRTSLVLYQAEPGSLVQLPQVLTWRGDALVPSPGRHERLERDLLASFDELLNDYQSDAASAAPDRAGAPLAPKAPRTAPAEDNPPRMVVDVALLKGRLLERRREFKAAFRAYALVTRLVPRSLTVTRKASPDRRELLLRAAEARRRAAALCRLPVHAALRGPGKHAAPSAVPPASATTAR